MPPPPRGKPVWGALLLVVTLLAGAAPGYAAHADTVQVADARYQAVIRRTSYGIPHIVGADLANASFGQGWAYAEDRFCDLADQVVKVRGERARWLGAGDGDRYLLSDIGYRALGLVQRAQVQLTGLSDDARAAVDGYVAGFNAYLARTGAAGARGWCAGAPWVGPITAVDLLAYQRDLAIVSGSGAFLEAIAAARPPGPAAPAAGGGRALATARLGSNGWAFGGQRTGTGRGALLANPHYPWQGEKRFWENQLTVPGRLNVYGASLGGLPGVQIGFNQQVAWTHTVADGGRFTLESLELVPGHPTSYLVDGRPEQMIPVQIAAGVRGDDGQVRPVSRTLWSTRYGPVIDASASDPALGWTPARAVALTDPNLDNDRLLDFWLDLDRANSVRDISAVHARHGTPWVNTVAADSSGEAWFGDAAATPNLPASALAGWASNPSHLVAGSDSANAPLPQAGDWPQLFSRDVVFNANNSPWVASPGVELDGFSPLLGAQGEPLSARARFVGLAAQRSAGVTLDALSALALLNRALSSDLLLDPVKRYCASDAAAPRTACAVLAGWDGAYNVDSRGAVLWREMMSAVLAAYPDALSRQGPLFADGFDAASPLHTPAIAAPDPGVLRQAITQASAKLAAAGLALDVPLGQVQHTMKGDRRLAIPGAPGELGASNVVGYDQQPGTSLEPVMPSGRPIAGSDLTSAGYVVNEGTSFLMAVEFTDNGPQARGLLTFSESTDPQSPYFADQTVLFARNTMRDCLFSEEAINADPALTVKAVEA
ncbi:Acyl-homoserine lactone acylase pvdQ precursor [Mycobacteroides abscessus subsp. abscessus]|uniref:penicillin acylase family protein n=1 Tax=Mycobacteroides abscessus TaxID=36809 RepID=UPI0005DF6DAE|nr:penicillin acylase family protein [Mycobacteroides abscessus]CPV55559.1 Acyl-homoserine lactone acylase pvdQ precursor [Mycobacteroides abscessus]SHQ64409.1 Acyl-homoserine lactone acylase pvdQ precursor [Mycobacteroides abscessus subsp. abscessus]SHR33013.1 Acyl-homoserine lactone acylase pvdQ precursor [Mycobacteroides abscessus subsp. abscessus]SHZ30387.1 Acyl-homoserine lactone acylase pvdQ precursor [Mycobacteroides abscessus subsp. abscessus]SKE49657.1 Acyl-homoserine lactone acylase 